MVERYQRLADLMELTGMLRARTTGVCIDEIVVHRFVYRQKDDVSFADFVERRSMGQHIDRLLANGQLEIIAGDRYRVPGA